MPELRQEYLDILEKREWSVSGYTDDGRVELEWWSPAGEDFLVCVNVENFPDEILNYSDDFDPDEHIEMWVVAIYTLLPDCIFFQFLPMWQSVLKGYGQPFS